LKSISIKRLRQIPLWQPLSTRDFRLFWMGQSISLLGDQFYNVALPWLVLLLTGSNLALGTVLLVAGATRAIFQLLGGALSDRLSPRTLMLISNTTGAMVTAITAAIVFFNIARPWQLYILGGAFGIIDAMFYPAYMSATPMLLIKEQLVPGNALLRSTVRLMGIIGPALAGFIVSAFAVNQTGYSAAFALDSLTFIFAAFMLSIMRMSKQRDSATDEDQGMALPDSQKKGLMASIAEGARYAWGSRLLKILFLFLAFFEFAVSGSMKVGLLALSNQQYGLERGPGMYGYMASSLAAGVLIGMVIAGSFDTTKSGRNLLAGLTAPIGACLIALGLSTHIVIVSGLLLLIGIGGGVLTIILQAWIQMNTEKRMLGRVMSLLMLGVLIMENASYALAGALADLKMLPMVFYVSGAMMLVSGAIAFATRTMHSTK
jgi:MFS family permease